MSLCTWLSELFCGKKEGPLAGSEELKPVAESFCRSTRRNEWVARITKDMKAIGADLIQIGLEDNESRFRGVLEYKDSLSMWDTTTLTEVTLEDIYNLGGRTGFYTSTIVVQDRAACDMNGMKAKSDIPVLQGFVNQVPYSGYCHTEEPNRQLSDVYAIFNTDYLGLVADFNATKQFLILTTDDGTKFYRKLSNIIKFGYGGCRTAYQYHTQDGKNVVLPNWVAAPLFRKDVLPTLVDENFIPCVMDDPIKIIELADDEDIGNEAYIYLVPSGRDTYTRRRFRVEVESERLFANKIVAIDPMLVTIGKRLSYYHFKANGKLFIDNIRYLRLDGTVHSADVGGFMTINAEPFRKGITHASDPYTSMRPYHSTGPLIVSHVVFPTEPIY